MENIVLQLDASSQEHFDQGSENDREYANQWLTVQGLTGFRPFMVAFYKQCEVVNLTLIQAVEAGFGLEAGCLVARCIPNNTDLRITHYPALPVEAVRTGGMTRIAPHTDFGVITLLFQDSTGGLEIEDRTRPGVYHPLPPTNTREMIVNVGDTLQRWTNGRLFSGRHRVTVPESLGDDAEELPERYSVAYLGKAQRHASVGPVASFVSVDNPAKYNDLNAQEYLNMRAQLVSSVGN